MLHLINKIFWGTLSESEPLQPQINNIVLAASKVNTLGLPLNDKLVTFTIISFLPPLMSILKKILSYTKPSNMTTENVTSQIILNEQQCVHESGDNVSAFFCKISKKGKGQKDNKQGEAIRKRSQCYQCYVELHSFM